MDTVRIIWIAVNVAAGLGEPLGPDPPGQVIQLPHCSYTHQEASDWILYWGEYDPRIELILLVQYRGFSFSGGGDNRLVVPMMSGEIRRVEAAFDTSRNLFSFNQGPPWSIDPHAAVRSGDSSYAAEYSVNAQDPPGGSVNVTESISVEDRGVQPVYLRTPYMCM